MRKILLTLHILSAYPLVSMGAVEGQWTYIVENGGATITASSATGAVTIPSLLGGVLVKKIGNGFVAVFGTSNTSVTSIVIPNGITSIADYAFQRCTRLASITIPESITTIGIRVFQECANLASITIPNSVTSLGAEGLFAYCTKLTSVTIPNSVTSIGEEWFSYCTSLTSVTIPSGVTRIGVSAFYNCTSITSIIIPSGVTSILTAAFSDCTSLSKITIPSGVTSIGAEAFRNCIALTQIVFLGNAPSYASNSFQGSSPTVYYVAGKTGWGSSYAGLSTAVLGAFLLTAICDIAQGSLAVNPIKDAYQYGDSVTIIASPKVGYLFSSWSGASTATTSSTALSMDADKTVTANFIQDNADNDGDSLSNFQESVTYGTNPNQKDSNADGVEDGHAVSMGYSPTLNFSALIAHPPTGLYTASQMQAMAFGDLVLTKNENGSFTLNYDIEQSSDLQSWLPYESFNLPLTNLPPDKAFIRFRAKQ